MKKIIKLSARNCCATHIEIEFKYSEFKKRAKELKKFFVDDFKKGSDTSMLVREYNIKYINGNKTVPPSDDFGIGLDHVSAKMYKNDEHKVFFSFEESGFKNHNLKLKAKNFLTIEL